MTARSGFRHPFPYRVDHRPDEPSYALVLRTALANGGRLVNAIFDKASPGDRSRVSRLDPVEIARICKAEPAKVVHASPATTPAGVELMGQTLRGDHFSVETRRWCPACLAEDGYHRVWWDVTVLGSCPVHGVELATSCGCEGRSLRWRHNSLVACRRGHDLRKVPVDAAHPDALALDAYVLARLLGEWSSAPAFMREVELGDLLVVCERIGKASVDERSTMFQVRKSSTRWRLHAEGFRVLLNLPAALHVVLDGLSADARGRAGGDGVLRAYGEFYNWVRTLPHAGPGRFLKEALASHAQANVALKSGTRLDGRVAVVHDGVPVSEAAVDCGMEYPRFIRLLDQLGIEVVGGGIGTRAEIGRSAYANLARRVVGFRNLKQVGVELSLGQEAVAELGRAGLLDMVAEGFGTSDWIFPVCAARELTSRIERAARRVPTFKHKFMPMTEAAARRRVSLVQVLKLGLRGEIDILLDGPAACFGNVHVDYGQVAGKLPRLEGAWTALSVVARDMGLKQSAMDAVVAAGILQVRRSDGIDEVDPVSVQMFEANYVAMPELRDNLGFEAFQPVATAMAAAGVEPVVRGARLTDYVYPRQAALDACAAAPRSVVAVPQGRSRKEIAAELRMDAKLLRQIVDAGLIRMQEGCRFGSIADAEVERFKERYASTSDLASTFGIAGWTTVLAIARAAGVDPICRPPEFCAFLFPRREAEDAIRVHLARVDDIKSAASEPEERQLTLDEVAEMLGAARNMAWQMARKGVLQSRMVGRAIVVPPSEVQRFKRDFVLGNELGMLAGRMDARGSGPAITRALLNAGVPPVCARPEFYSYVFERERATDEMRRLGLIKG